MTLFLLVRHALTDLTGKRLSGQAPGLHLSETGREQAERLRARLAPLPLAAVYSSPLERCAETAEIAVQGRGLEVRLVPSLSEVDYGRWTGRPFTQLVRTTLWKHIQSNPSSVRFPEGETLMEVQRRCVEALDEIARRHPKKMVMVVSHADAIRLTLAHFVGVHLDLYQRMSVSPTSVSALLLGDRIPRILRMNDTGSLEDLVPRRPSGSGRGPAKRGGRLR